MAATAIEATEGRRQSLMRSLEEMQPRVLYGLRMLASVALAMWVSFWLQLDNAYWAPLTAAIVCQPTIGASLRKGQFRVIGTCTGALAIVVLTALMPQARIGLIAGLAAWGMIAGFMATVLRNAAAYAASLAGYTAAIVFSDSINGSPNGVFLLAITRATEISIGVLSAGLVLSATDTGDARRRLAQRFIAILDGIAKGITETLRNGAPEMVAKRRELIGTLAALDPLMDEALGETADLRYRSGILKGGTKGLLRALSAWNEVSTHLTTPENWPDGHWPMPLLSEGERIDDTDWDDAAMARDRFREMARHLVARQADTISERLLLDRCAETLLGLARGANAVALLDDPSQASRDWSQTRLYVPDLFVALTNGLRVAFTMLLAATIWIEFAWPGGQSLMVFGAVITILFAPQADLAHKIVPEFGLGVVCAAVLAAIVSFAVLPGQQSYLALVLAIGAVMVPSAFMAAGSWHRFVFTAIDFIFLALIAPSNQQSYDLSSFLNGAQGIVAGVVVGLLGFRLFPPLSKEWKVQRLLALTLRDVRRFAAGRKRRAAEDWLGLLITRVGALPGGTDPADRARLVSGLNAGTQVLRLRNLQAGIAQPGQLESSLGLLAQGEVERCADGLRDLARVQPDDAAGLRAQVEITLLSDTLLRHAPYFADRRRPATAGAG
ncbi:FUSC family protein [Acetobacteraceae bacterium KSS8]|uniref:FUSC family protein n=1 Tax=Endosaccharibacter trunci TaxID=2812733 RepID=A0ABT1W9P0_9PROT|nr:FUSC family protein [Acetobacteraceae bacterium KSS8]